MSIIINGQTNDITVGGIGVTLDTESDLKADKVTTYTKTEVDSKPTGFKNYIINGNFDVWQRGTSQTTSGYGSDDRWANFNNGSTKTHSQVACTDTERALFNASKFSRTVVSSVAGADNFVLKAQRIEDITRLSGKTVTLSFWARADSNKNIAIDFEYLFGTGGSPSAYINGFGVNKLQLTTTWQKKTITVTLPSIIGKTLGTDGVHTTSTTILFWFDAGSNLNLRTNSLGQQSGTFDIAQVQLEEGSVATPFEQRPYGLELSLCQRYYIKLASNNYSRYGIGNATSGTRCLIHLSRTEMRTTPTMGINGNTNLYNGLGAVAVTNLSLQSDSSNKQQVTLQALVSSTLTAGNTYELTSNGVSLITLDAEL